METSGASLLAYLNELIRPGLKEEALSLITGLVVAGHEVGLTHRILQQQARVVVGAAWLPSLRPPQGPQGYGVRPYWSPPPAVILARALGILEPGVVLGTGLDGIFPWLRLTTSENWGSDLLKVVRGFLRGYRQSTKKDGEECPHVFRDKPWWIWGSSETAP